MNGLPDHIHIAVAIPPRIAVSDWVKRVKGTSSYEVNKAFPNEATFAWQIKFGCSTFGIKQMPFVKNYIKKQAEHHAQNTTYWYLERTDENEGGDEGE
jgi:putative transposase